MKIKYVGPHDGVDIPVLHASCARGGTVDVEDEELARSFLAQEIWEPADAGSRRLVAQLERQAGGVEASEPEGPTTEPDEGSEG